MSQENFQSNPAELALPYTDVVMHETRMVGGEEESRVLVELDSIAEQAGMFGNYFIESSLGFVIPASFDEDDKTKGIKLGEGASLRGNFCTYSVLKIGSIPEAETSIRALCLAFDSAVLLPYIETIPETDILHVPVLSISEITRSTV